MGNFGGICPVSKIDYCVVRVVTAQLTKFVCSVTSESINNLDNMQIIEWLCVSDVRYQRMYLQ